MMPYRNWDQTCQNVPNYSENIKNIPQTQQIQHNKIGDIVTAILKGNIQH